MPTHSTERQTVVFIHGLWIHTAAWRPWQELFTQHGYDPHAPGWTGDSPTAEATRTNQEDMAELGLAELTAGYEQFISTLPSTPIVVGHSFGGLIAQKLLASGHARSAAVISPAPIRGADKLPLAQIRSALPVLRRPKNKHRAVALSPRQFRYAFGNAISKDESRRLFESYAIPGTGKPVFELTAAKKNPNSPTAVDTTTADRGPLLIIGAGKDHTVPEVVSRQAHSLYAGSPARTDYHVFPDRGHALAFDSHWGEIAAFTMNWLQEHATDMDQAPGASSRRDVTSP